jgi:hypothetical protein
MSRYGAMDGLNEINNQKTGRSNHRTYFADLDNLIGGGSSRTFPLDMRQKRST